MELFEAVFNPSTVYGSFYLNAKAVLEYKDLETLKKEKPEMFLLWNNISDKLYSQTTPHHSYNINAVNYPEFTKLVCVTYGTLSFDGEGNLKRNIKQIVNDDEVSVLKSLYDVLNQVSVSEKGPKTICGHGVKDYIIPLIVKRYLKNMGEMTEEQTKFPTILKSVLNSKPWNSSKMIDVIDVWRFNGVGRSSIQLISEFMGLKKNVELMSNQKISEYYWENIGKSPEKTLKNISLQSANELNLVVQLMYKLRKV